MRAAVSERGWRAGIVLFYPVGVPNRRLGDRLGFLPAGTAHINSELARVGARSECDLRRNLGLSEGVVRADRAACQVEPKGEFITFVTGVS